METNSSCWCWYLVVFMCVKQQQDCRAIRLQITIFNVGLITQVKTAVTETNHLHLCVWQKRVLLPFPHIPSLLAQHLPKSLFYYKCFKARHLVFDLVTWSSSSWLPKFSHPTFYYFQGFLNFVCTSTFWTSQWISKTTSMFLWKKSVPLSMFVQNEKIS